MRIISSFRDYYDGVAAYDEDRSTQFVRKAEMIDVKRRDVPEIIGCHDNRHKYSGIWSANFVIGFAGKMYPGEWYSGAKGTTIIFDPVVLRDREESDYAWQYKNKQRSWLDHYEQPEVARKLSDLYGPQFLISSDACLPKPPTIVDPCGHAPFGHVWIYKNVRLADFGFAKVLDPFQAYGLLQTFVCNQSRPGRPIPEMSDELKAHQHGFSPKESFRRDKGCGPARKRRP